MSSQRSTDEQVVLRLSISPEPSDEELLAIMNALQMLYDESHQSPDSEPAGSGWDVRARDEGMRARNWPYQVQSWAFPRG